MNFLMTNKIWLTIIGGLLGIALGLFIEVLALKNELKNIKEEIQTLNLELAQKEINLQISKANLSECNAKIDLQNEKFKSIALDNETLKKQIKKAKASAKARYENLKPPDTGASCEEKLNLALGVIKGLGKKE